MTESSLDPGRPAGPAPEPPTRRPWWSPRRPWLPLAIAILVAAGVGATGMNTVEDREDLEAGVDRTESKIEELEGQIERSTEGLGGAETAVERRRRIALDCIEAARIGVQFLHSAVQWMGFVGRNERDAAERERHEVNRLIKKANDASRPCRRGLL